MQTRKKSLIRGYRMLGKKERRANAYSLILLAISIIILTLNWYLQPAVGYSLYLNVFSTGMTLLSLGMVIQTIRILRKLSLFGEDS